VTKTISNLAENPESVFNFFVCGSFVALLKSTTTANIGIVPTRLDQSRTNSDRYSLNSFCDWLKTLWKPSWSHYAVKARCGVQIVKNVYRYLNKSGNPGYQHKTWDRNEIMINVKLGQGWTMRWLRPVCPEHEWGKNLKSPTGFEPMDYGLWFSSDLRQLPLNVEFGDSCVL